MRSTRSWYRIRRVRGASCLIALLGCGRVNFDASSVIDASPDTAVDAPDPLDRDLVFRASFERGFVDDIADRALTCITANCPTLTTGQVGATAALFGPDQCLLVDDDPALRSPVYAYALWFRPSRTTSIENLFGRTLDSETGAANTFELTYELGQAVIYGGGQGFFVDAAVNSWHHVAGVLTQDLLVGYLDGVRVGELATTPQLVNGQAFRIGCDRNNASNEQFFEGEIDDVRLYTRELTDSEIAALASP